MADGEESFFSASCLKTFLPDNCESRIQFMLAAQSEVLERCGKIKRGGRLIAHPRDIDFARVNKAPPQTDPVLGRDFRG